MQSNIYNAVRTKRCYQFFLFISLLTFILGVLFARSFDPNLLTFSNDGPLGAQVSGARIPDPWMGCWQDSNSIGDNGGTLTPNISILIGLLAGSVVFLKIYAAVALWILGFGAWHFFRQLKLSPLAAGLGALAAALNSAYFGNAAWGVASGQIALGMNFLALALVMANTTETRWHIRWSRLALAGLCVGMNVIEAADIGALYSVLVAAFIFYKSFIEPGGNYFARAARSVGRVVLVAGFAGFMASQTVVGLVQTQIVGIAGTSQDSETKAQHWDWATQWSLPKKETLALVVPGLFGYRMDTPRDMIPQVKNAYEGGAYWGGLGRSPELDRFLDDGSNGTPPSGFMRFTGSVPYCGILVMLIAAWTIAQSLRKKNSAFTSEQKHLIWFWALVMLVTLPIAWGRFAGFYSLLYQLPYFSSIRNPIKFLYFFSMALVTVFAFGIHALNRRYLDGASAKPADLTSRLKNWWAIADGFDRNWTFACGGILGASALGWLIYSGQKPSLISYLQKVGFGEEALAREIATFSITQAGWFILLFAIASALVILTIAGYFSGPRAKTGAVLLGTFLLFDLVRADLPYVIHWDYKLKYEVGALNPIEDFLRDKTYEHRVARLPFDPQQPLRGYDNAFCGLGGIYSIEWTQHHFLYHNIQSLDIVQMSRMPENLKAYLEALSPRGTPESLPLMTRHWQLTNTRYLLGAAGFLNVLNQQLDPGKNRFRIAQRFDIVPKPGFLQPQALEQLTAQPTSDGDLALFEFTGALPRAKLYSNWQVNTNGSAVLKTLADLNFDPEKTVLIDTPSKNLPLVSTNENNGSVAFTSYGLKHIVFAATNPAPAVLLLNDQYDPGWRVRVDGQPAELLRCNFMMRGVYLPAGTHTVEFNFTLPHPLLYVTLAAMLLGILLGVYLLIVGRKAVTNPSDDPRTPTAR